MNMNTEELIHTAYVMWKNDRDEDNPNEEESFSAGARSIINYLINKGKI